MIFLTSLQAYQENELGKAKENVVKYSETNEHYEAQILALQRENNEAYEKLKTTENTLLELSQKIVEVEEENLIINELKMHINQLDAEVTDKTKVRLIFLNQTIILKISFKAIKILNQRLLDVKKSLNEEIKNNSSGSTGSMMSSQPAILIPVNVDNNSNHNHQTIPFNLRKTSNIPTSVVLDEHTTYLKHVLLKFLTTESKHLIRPVSTLLYLTEAEEKLLEEVLEYRNSWFKSKPSY